MSRLSKALMAITCGLALLNGAAALAESDHEPITICAPNRDVGRFAEAVHEKYPEINLEIVPYSGRNATAFLNAQFTTGNTTDIFMLTFYTPDMADASDKMLDLSKYDFTGNYVEARLHEVLDDGAVYFVPSYYTCMGITYNRKILEDNGWALPTSFKELEELKPKVEAAGYQFCIDQLTLPGYGFQYLCNIADTGYLSTVGGRRWQKAFLSGETTLADSPKMLECFQTINRWREAGMLNGNSTGKTVVQVRDEMAAGNTLFMLGSSNDFSNFGEDVASQFGLMPYLSEDGDQNIYILSVSSYFGLSKRLGEPGNEQKLEDALHVMAVLSTVEGMTALNNETINTSMMPLKDAPLSENNYYKTPEVLDAINSGYTAPLLYTGWENMVVDMGNLMLDFIDGKCEIEDAIARFDADQKMITENEVETFTTVTETIGTEDCAKMVGIAFAEATGADAALVSINQYHGIVGDIMMNSKGVNGELYAMPITDQEITAITPTGWKDNIEVAALTGAEIDELAQTGYVKKAGEPAYPYIFVKKDGMTFESDKTYTVVLCGVSEALAESGKVKDSGVLGLDAMKTYMSRFETMTAKDIQW